MRLICPWQFSCNPCFGVPVNQFACSLEAFSCTMFAMVTSTLMILFENVMLNTEGRLDCREGASIILAILKAGNIVQRPVLSN